MSKYKKYPSYKDSGVEWLSAIPNSWISNKIKNICYINDGNHGEEYPSENDYTVREKGIPFIRAGNILNLKITSRNMLYITKEKNSSMRKGNLQYMDILFTNRGEIGKVAIIEEDFIGSNLNSQIAYVRPDNAQINTKYLAYSLTSDTVRYMKDSLSAGSVLTQFPIKDLSNIPVLYPPISEQQQISNFLDNATQKIDTLITKQERLIELLKEKRQAVISHAVTRGLNPDVKFKESGVEWLGDVPAHWGVKKLGTVSKKIGSGKTPKGGADVYSDTGVIFIRSQNVYDEGLRLEDVVYISESINAEMENTQVKSGDILLNVTGGSIGRTTLVPENFKKANVNQHVCIIRLNDKKYNPFISLLMKSLPIKIQIDAIQNGAAREGLNFEQIASFKITMPPLEEQQQIANYLDDKTKKIDTLIDKSKQSIVLLKEKRTALISAAVTGKIDVREVI